MDSYECMNVEAQFLTYKRLGITAEMPSLEEMFLMITNTKRRVKFLLSNWIISCLKELLGKLCHYKSNCSGGITETVY